MTYPVGPNVMNGFVTGLELDESALRRRYSTLGVTLQHLVLALVAGSEITTVDPARAQEQRLVMECLISRVRWSGFPGGFPGGVRGGDATFGVAVGPCGRTGTYGALGRPFSTSRLATGAPLTYLLGLAHEVIEARGKGDDGGGVTSFAHKQPRALAKLVTRWGSLGYELATTFSWPNGKTGAFFRPTATKRAELDQAAARHGR
jgi:hypothetical protein